MNNPTVRIRASHLALVHSAGSATRATETPAGNEREAHGQPGFFDREVGYIYDTPFYLPDEEWTGDV